MNYTAEEFGRPGKEPDPIDILGQPRGDARYPVPHVAQFGGSAGTLSSRSYYMQSDEATLNNRENAERMRLDPVIDACMRSLTYPIVLLTNSIAPDDPEDPAQVAAAARAEKRLKNLPGFLFAKQWLISDGVFTGRSAVKVRWQAVQKRDSLVHLPTGFEQVSGDKLAFKYTGQVGILVQPSFPGETEPVTGGAGRAYFLSPNEREQLLLFQFEPADTTFYNPLKAGAIMGQGLRDKLYWLWSLKMRVWGMGMDFLQWFARGVMIYYFRSGNAEHARAVKNWVEAQAGNSAILFPYFTGSEREFKPVEMFQPSTASPQFLQQLITEYFDKLMKEIILGQTLTSGTAATGLGSGVAAAHQDTFDNRVRYISAALDEVLSRDLLVPYYRANEPGVTPGRWTTDFNDPNAQSLLENAKMIVDMGGAVPEEPLLEAAGVPQIKTGDTLLTNVQPMQPAGVDVPPNNVPQTGQDPVPDAPGAPVPGPGQLVQLSRRLTAGQWQQVHKLAARGHTTARRLVGLRRR